MAGNLASNGKMVFTPAILEGSGLGSDGQVNYGEISVLSQ